MSLRSYNFPSSEVKEVDLTTETISNNGSVVLVAGFSHKGQIFSPTKIYSTTSFINVFGSPMNDAEFYLYTAVENIISKQGVPIVIRLPYNNVASKNYNIVGLTVAQATAIESITFTGNPPDATAITAMLSAASTAKGFTQACKLTTSKVSVTNAQMAAINSNSDFSSISSLATTNFAIVDKQKSICSDVEHRNGMFIVIFDALRAMLVQRLLSGNTTTTSDGNLLASNIGLVNQVVPLGGSTAISDWSIPLNGSVIESLSNIDGGTSKVYSADSLSKQIANLFPSFDTNIVNSAITINPEYSNYIGIAVCKITESDSLVTKNVPSIVESFVGCIAPRRNKTTGNSEYIVDIVNSGSSYISMYANRLNQTEVGQTTVGVSDTMKALPVVGGFDSLIFSDPANSNIELTSFEYGSNNKIISGATIGADLVTALTKVENVDDVQIDTVCDAGLSSIAQFTDSVGGEYYQPDTDINSSNGKITSVSQISTWTSIVNKMEQFCSGSRKDCMALIDAPRHATLTGSATLINEFDYTKTFANDEEPGFSIVSTALNSSYAAIYGNWVKSFNNFTNSEVWVPLSCYVAAACCACDLKWNPWNSPAYLERGVISGVTDLSLRPGKAEESFLYPKSINYGKYFTNEGFVIWGQKTTQKKEGAFSRINVRRSVLRMERYIYQVGRAFIGKGNSVYNRRLWIDILDPYLSSIKSAGGLYDYMLICDETNNTGAVIDANEFRGTCLLKPIKEADYIIATVVATNTDASFTEVLASGNF